MFVFQIAEQAQLLYLVGFFQSFSDLNTVAVRSAMTKVVGPKEVGRVFACVALSAGVVQLIKPMYEKIYSATLDWYFGFVFCISDMITIVMICLAVYVFIYMKYVERKKAAADEPANPDTDAAETPAQNYKRIDFELTNSMLIAAYDKADGDSNGRASIATISSTVIKNLSQQQ